MAKAINWPQEFYDEIMAEDMTSPRIALRIGSLYFDNFYYNPNEIVDIRVNHKVVRQAQILGEMKLLKIKDISDEDISRYKKSISTKSAVESFLSKNYNQDVNQETEVTLVTYKNLEITTPEDDDPHM
jgi:hypothetical protein